MFTLKKCILLAIPFILFITSTVLASPVDDTKVRDTALGWLNLGKVRLSSNLSDGIAEIKHFESATEKGSFYVVYLDPEGFIILSGDDELEPVIAFSPEGRYDNTFDNPASALINRDIDGRYKALAKYAKSKTGNSSDGIAGNYQNKWNELASVKAGAKLGLNSVSDLRVEPFLKTKWGQTTAQGKACYNYYTPTRIDPLIPQLFFDEEDNPKNFPSGCVATATAQVMKYYEYPTKSIPQAVLDIFYHYTDDNNILQTREDRRALIGGIYNWADMPDAPETDAQLSDLNRQEIGKLCHDVGVASHSDYSQSVTYSNGRKAKYALELVFRYAQAAVWTYQPQAGVCPSNNMINPNLDAGSPLIFGITSFTENGIDAQHEIVCDGYGYDNGTSYHHLNIGWAGAGDLWYNLPTIDYKYNWSSIDDCIFNISASYTGEIISGRVLDSDGNPKSGVTVTGKSDAGTYSSTTNDKGIYSLAGVRSNTGYTVSCSEYPTAQRIVVTGNTLDDGQSLDVGNRWGINFPTSPVWSVGSNDWGQLGNGTFTTSFYEYVQSLVPDAIFVCASDRTSFFVMSDGTLMACGNNENGNFGNGTADTDKHALPVQAGNNITGFKKISGRDGGTVLALKTNGAVMAWGRNDKGQIGNGSTIDSYSPVQVMSNAKDISYGLSFSTALDNSGNVWTWGENGVGQLGIGSDPDNGGIEYSTSPVQAQVSGISMVSAGATHCLALDANGDVWGWGSNVIGQLGIDPGVNGENSVRFTPFKLTCINNVAAVYAGNSNSFFLKKDGTLWVCGGQLVGYQWVPHFVPIQVPNLTDLVQINDLWALKKDGTFWAITWEGVGVLAVKQIEGLPPLNSFSVGSGHGLALVTPSLTISVFPAMSATTSPESGQYPLRIGEKMDISVYPNAGYQFDSWSVAGNATLSDLSSSTTTVTMNGEAAVTARFKVQLTINVSSTAEGTTKPETGDYFVKPCTPSAIEAKPEAGYHFVNWTADETISIEDENSLSTTFSVSDIGTITANFAKDGVQVNLTMMANPSAGGTTSPSGTTTVNTGSQMQISATSASGYHFSGWTALPATSAIFESTSSATTNLTVSGDVAVTANFAKDGVQVNLTMVANPSDGGTIIPSGTGKVNMNEPITIHANAGSDYSFLYWTVTGNATLASQNFHTTVTLIGDATVTANFALIPVPVQLTMTSSPENGGTTSPSGTTTGTAGGLVVISATSTSGYHFVNWTASPAANATIENASSATTNMTLKRDVTITANFAVTPAKAALTMAAAPAGAGTVSPDGSSVDTGVQIKITAVPAATFSFSGWTASSANASFEDASSASTNLRVYGDVTVTGNFIVTPTVPMTCGMVFALTPSAISGYAGDHFVEKPKVSAEYIDPVKKTSKHVALKVNTKDAWQQTSLECEWRVVVKLFDAKLWDKTKTCAQNMEANLISPLSCDLKVNITDTNWIKIKDAPAGKVKIYPPSISNVFDGGNPTVITSASLQQKIRITGTYFGKSPPNVSLEYKDKKGNIKLLRLKFIEGIDGKICMDNDTGSSAVTVQAPKKWPKGWNDFSTDHNIVIDNKIGRATIQFQTEE